MKKGIPLLVALSVFVFSSLCMAFEVKVKVASDGKNAATYQAVAMSTEKEQTQVASAPAHIAANQTAMRDASSTK